MCAQDSTGVMALICKQHVDLECKRLWEAAMQRLLNQGVRVYAVIKTLRYRNPMVETTAAVNPIVMASHGWRIADMETPTATPPARTHDCKWIWRRRSELVLSLLVLKKVQVHSLQPIATLFIKQHSSEITYLISSYQVEFSLGTREHRHSSCGYSTDSQGQVGAAHCPQLPPRSTIVHKDWIKAGPKHPEKRRPWRTEDFPIC